MDERSKKPSPEVSRRMKRVRSRGTGLEKAMERILRGAAIRFSRQPKMRGKPDFRIKDTNVLIFCDSEFWHGKRVAETSGKAFKKNKRFWTKKINENKKRDLRTNRTLRRQGWSVHRFWDKDILKAPKKVERRLRRIVDGRNEGKTKRD